MIWPAVTKLPTSTGVAMMMPVVCGATSEESTAMKLPVACTVAETWRTTARTVVTDGVAAVDCAAGADLAEVVEPWRLHPTKEIRRAEQAASFWRELICGPQYLPEPGWSVARRLHRRSGVIL